MPTVNQAQKRGLGAIFWLLLALGVGKAVSPAPAPTPIPEPGPVPMPPAPVPVPPIPPEQPPSLPPGIPAGSIFDPASNSFTSPDGNIWTQNADGSWSLSPIPPGSSFNPVTNTWTDPTGTVWTQNMDGSWSSGAPPPGLRLHMFPVGSRVNLTIPEGVFPATVTRHEGHSSQGEPLYGLTLDIGVNATAIPESLLSPGPPPVIAPPPPVDREFRNVSISFSQSEVLSNQPGVVRVTITGEYKGPATSVQARLLADDPFFQGDQALSVEALLPDSGDFFPFGPLQTGNLSWPAFTFEAGSQLSLAGVLIETDGIGTVLSAVSSTTLLLAITAGGGACLLENNRAEILVQDVTGTHPLVQIGDQDHAEITTRSTPFSLTWSVRNQGTGPQSVRLEVLCGRTEFRGGAARLPFFNILATIVGPSFLVGPGQERLLSMTVSLADFPKCDGASRYVLQMVGSDPSCGNHVGEQAHFQVLFSAPALSLATMGGFP